MREKNREETRKNITSTFNSKSTVVCGPKKKNCSLAICPKRKICSLTVGCGEIRFFFVSINDG